MSLLLCVCLTHVQEHMRARLCTHTHIPEGSHLTPRLYQGKNVKSPSSFPLHFTMATPPTRHPACVHSFSLIVSSSAPGLLATRKHPETPPIFSQSPHPIVPTRFRTQIRRAPRACLSSAATYSDSAWLLVCSKHPLVPLHTRHLP